MVVFDGGVKKSISGELGPVWTQNLLGAYHGESRPSWLVCRCQTEMSQYNLPMVLL
jgi:hypothetical protein